MTCRNKITSFKVNKVYYETIPLIVLYTIYKIRIQNKNQTPYTDY